MDGKKGLLKVSQRTRKCDSPSTLVSDIGAEGFDCDAVAGETDNPERNGDNPGVDPTLHLTPGVGGATGVPELRVSVTYASTTERGR
jgi:hypothetical protein